jgi:hypothetical protein
VEVLLLVQEREYPPGDIIIDVSIDGSASATGGKGPASGGGIIIDGLAEVLRRIHLLGLLAKIDTAAVVHLAKRAPELTQ